MKQYSQRHYALVEDMKRAEDKRLTCPVCKTRLATEQKITPERYSKGDYHWCKKCRQYRDISKKIKKLEENLRDYTMTKLYDLAKIPIRKLAALFGLSPTNVRGRILPEKTDTAWKDILKNEDDRLKKEWLPNPKNAKEYAINKLLIYIMESPKTENQIGVFYIGYIKDILVFLARDEQDFSKNHKS